MKVSSCGRARHPNILSAFRLVVFRIGPLAPLSIVGISISNAVPASASFSVRAMSSNVTTLPPTAMNRCPLADSAVIARIWRSAKSRTSTVPNDIGGRTWTPSSICLMSQMDVGMSGPITGPRIPTGLTTDNSRLPPSRATKSQAARSASVLDFIYGCTSGPSGFVQSVSSKTFSYFSCP